MRYEKPYLSNEELLCKLEEQGLKFSWDGNLFIQSVHTPLDIKGIDLS